MEKDLHMGKVMWVVNKALGEKCFDTDFVNIIDRYMRRNPKVTVDALLSSDDYSKIY